MKKLIIKSKVLFLVLLISSCCPDLTKTMTSSEKIGESLVNLQKAHISLLDSCKVEDKKGAKIAINKMYNQAIKLNEKVIESLKSH